MTTSWSDSALNNLRIPDQELEVLKALNRGGVQYLLIGGYAMRYYGATGPTTDVDLLVGQAPENAQRLLRAIAKVIGHPPGFSESMLAKPKERVSFRNDGYRVDILTSVDGLAFDAAYQERQFALEKRLVIPIASKLHLALVKRVAASADPRRREKELCDIAFLDSHGTV